MSTQIIDTNALIKSLTKVNETIANIKPSIAGLSISPIKIGHNALDSLGKDGPPTKIESSLAIGSYAGAGSYLSRYDVIIGEEAAKSYGSSLSTRADYWWTVWSVVIGYQAAAHTSTKAINSTPQMNIGSSKGCANSVVIGSSAFMNLQNIEYCVGIGEGVSADSSLLDIQKSVAIGSEAKVFGNNQIQLGASGTTTYVYGTVQNRSDERDKADITPLTYDYRQFIQKLKPVNFRWDMREDYIDKDNTISINDVVRDGSHKRSRLHNGFIAQDVKRVMDEMGFDFAGYQDFSHDGSTEILTLGYEEFIAPIVATIQDLIKEVDDLKKQLNEIKK